MVETAFRQVVDSLGIELIEYGTEGFYYAIYEGDDFESMLGCVEDLLAAERIKTTLARYYGIEVNFTDVEMW